MLAQQAPTTGDFFIAGTVVNSLTGERIKGALVSLDSRDPQKVVLADAAGAFRFSGLPAGTYSISATKPGHRTSLGSVTATVGPSREDVALRLEPLAAIHGRILDSYGDPLSAVLVHALQARSEDGRRRLLIRRWARSNDRGDYYLPELEPGRYYLRVAGRDAATMHFIGEFISPDSGEAFPPVYYDAADSAARATPLTLEPGVLLSAGFRLPLRPARSISGVVTNAVPYRPVKIALLAGEEDVSGARAAINTADGRFYIRDVPDGAYTLSITQGEGAERTRALQPVQVAGRDLQGLSLLLTPGRPVQGTVRLDGALPPNQPPRCSILLKSAGPSAGDKDFSGSMDRNWEFQIPAVLEGRYRVSVDSNIGYMASLIYGGRDLLPGAELTVDAAPSAPPLEIVLRSDGGQVTGSLKAGDRPVGALLVLLPADGSDRNLRTMRGYPTGRFTFDMVPPGEYFLLAWAEDAAPEFAAPEVRRGLIGRGERVQVTPKGIHTVNPAVLPEAPR